MEAASRSDRVTLQPAQVDRRVPHRPLRRLVEEVEDGGRCGRNGRLALEHGHTQIL
jgi:hypothetical protein